MKSDADDPVTGAEGAGFFFKASTILNAWPSRTPHFLSAAILIRVSSFMHANPAAASDTAYCEYPSCCKKFTRSALGFFRMELLRQNFARGKFRHLSERRNFPREILPWRNFPPPCSTSGARSQRGLQSTRARDALEGAGRYPLPLQGAQPMPSHCPPDAKCQPQRHLQPTVTAPNRFGNPLQPPVYPPLGPARRSVSF